jgi:hypothetical protein
LAGAILLMGEPGSGKVDVNLDSLDLLRRPTQELWIPPRRCFWDFDQREDETELIVPVGLMAYL